MVRKFIGNPYNQEYEYEDEDLGSVLLDDESIEIDSWVINADEFNEAAVENEDSESEDNNDEGSFDEYDADYIDDVDYEESEDETIDNFRNDDDNLMSFHSEFESEDDNVELPSDSDSVLSL